MYECTKSILALLHNDHYYCRLLINFLPASVRGKMSHYSDIEKKYPFPILLCDGTRFKYSIESEVITLLHDRGKGCCRRLFWQKLQHMTELYVIQQQ